MNILLPLMTHSPLSRTAWVPQAPASEPATFLLEVGTEELPVSDLLLSLEQLGAAVPQMLEEARDGDHVVFMSNGGFDAAPRRFTEALQPGGGQA